jgi:hypothetical protein
MVPMHVKNGERALHEPTVRCPGFSRSGPPEGGTPNEGVPPNRFMVQMHGRKAEAFHEPTVWCPGFSRLGPPEGGTLRSCVEGLACSPTVTVSPPPQQCVVAASGI